MTRQQTSKHITIDDIMYGAARRCRMADALGCKRETVERFERLMFAAHDVWGPGRRRRSALLDRRLAEYDERKRAREAGSDGGAR